MPRAVRRGLLGLVVLVSLVIVLAPGSDVPPSPYDVDKLVHATLFGALALSGWWAGVRPARLAAALPLYAAATELAQAVPALHRDTSVGDLLADVTGAVLVLVVLRVRTRRRAGGPALRRAAGPGSLTG